MSSRRADKRKKREQREKKRAQKQARDTDSRDRACRRVVTMLGIEELWRNLPAVLWQKTLENRFPNLSVRIDESFSHHPEGARVLDAVAETVRTPAQVIVADRSFFISMNDLYAFYPVVTGSVCTLAQIVPGDRESRLRHLEGQILAAFEKVNKWRAQFSLRVFAELARQIELILDEYYRIDQCTLFYELQRSIVKGKLAATILLKQNVPKQVSLVVDGKRRKAYRVEFAEGPLGLVRITWPSALVNAPGRDRPMPVVVQDHAIRRLLERLSALGTWILHSIMLHALRVPKLHPAEAGRFLVEVHLGPYLLGYLVAQPLAQAVVIRTFLFLTMQGTPEAALLEEKLRLRRIDIEFHELDRLDTFIDSDLKDDPIVAALLEECGCGHLLSLAREARGPIALSGVAERLRDDLRISDANEGVRIGRMWRRLGARAAQKQPPAGADAGPPAGGDAAARSE